MFQRSLLRQRPPDSEKPKNRPGTVILCFATALFVILFDNISFWRALLSILGNVSPEQWGFLISVFISLLAILNLLLSLFSFPYVFKAAAISLLLTAACAGYFMDAYGIMIDRMMIQNVVETDAAEVLELLNLQLLYHFVLFGVIPSVIVYRVDIHYVSFRKETLKKLWVALLSIMIITPNLLGFYKDYASVYRNNRYIRHLVNPLNYISAIKSGIRHAFNDSAVTVLPIGEDATLTTAWQSTGKKTLTIFVLGEAARARDFSLNGYGRITNPLLSKEAIINFSNFYSCGTATAASLPCIFSRFTRNSFSTSRAKRYENLLDVLSHAGINVLWRENNSGCKGVCARITTEDLSHLQMRDYCNAKECHDEILLHDLEAYVEKIDNDSVIVLHQKGSHGPAYYRRYPDPFNVFTPACTTKELHECRRREILNSYDNTILYTDYFLSRVIAFLKENSGRFDSAMLYVSDHGESLGENNIYLHGLPYLIAPDEQKHIPFILWFSDGFTKDRGLDISCLRKRSNRRYSHDNIFHSMLGLTGVHTGLYDVELDIFAGCIPRPAGNSPFPGGNPQDQ